jgi:hypothetical protein
LLAPMGSAWPATLAAPEIWQGDDMTNLVAKLRALLAKLDTDASPSDSANAYRAGQRDMLKKVLAMVEEESHEWSQDTTPKGGSRKADFWSHGVES